MRFIYYLLLLPLESARGFYFVQALYYAVQAENMLFFV